MVILSFVKSSLSGVYLNLQDNICKNLIRLGQGSINLKKDTKVLSKDLQDINSLMIRDYDMTTPWFLDLDTIKLKIKRIEESLSAKSTKIFRNLLYLDLGYIIINYRRMSSKSTIISLGLREGEDTRSGRVLGIALIGK